MLLTHISLVASGLLCVVLVVAIAGSGRRLLRYRRGVLAYRTPREEPF